MIFRKGRLRMEKKKTTFMGNVAAILGSQVLIKLIGFIYNQVLINMPGFGDLGNGYRTAGYQVYTMLLAISSVGIPNAISKLISERLTLGDRRGAERVFQTALRLFALIGVAGTVLLYAGADFIALKLVRMDGVQDTLRALSPSILFVCLSSVIRGYFLGQQNVRPNNRSQTLEQIFKATLTILIVWLLSSTTAARMAAGANLATSISTALSFFYLVVVLITFRRRNHMPRASRAAPDHWKQTARQILSLSIPISLSSIITTVARVVDTATISRGIARAFAGGIPGAEGIPTEAQLQAYAAQMSGMLNKADNITNLPLAINIAFATVLVPTIAAALAAGDRKTASRKISYSYLISTLIILPCAAGLILLAKPFFLVFYPRASEGAPLLQWAAVALIFTALDQTICGSLQGLGRAAEELVFGQITTGASNDIEQATKIARAMITRYGMTEEFDMVAMETVTNQYLGGDTQLACSAETQKEIDRKVVETVRTQHEKARRLLSEHRDKLDALAAYLYEKETITGSEFMAILKGKEGAEA